MCEPDIYTGTVDEDMQPYLGLYLQAIRNAAAEYALQLEYFDFEKQIAFLETPFQIYVSTYYIYIKTPFYHMPGKDISGCHSRIVRRVAPNSQRRVPRRGDVYPGTDLVYGKKYLVLNIFKLEVPHHPRIGMNNVSLV